MKLNYHFQCFTEWSKKVDRQKGVQPQKENCAALRDGRRLLYHFLYRATPALARSIFFVLSHLTERTIKTRFKAKKGTYSEALFLHEFPGI